MKKIRVTKIKFIVLKVIPVSTILDTQTHSSDGCSGLTLFPSQRNCQAIHTRQRSLQLVGTSRTVGVPLAAPGVLATQWTHSPAPSKWTLEHSVRDDYVCNILLDDFVISSGTKLDVDNVARVLDQQLSLDCFTHAMIDDSRMFPRSVLQADTIIVSCGLAKFERISLSMQRYHKI